MTKKTKTQDQTNNQDQPNPAILAVSEILPTLSYHELICTMSFIMKEVSKRHAE
jgi:hypothetical protein